LTIEDARIMRTGERGFVMTNQRWHELGRRRLRRLCGVAAGLAILGGGFPSPASTEDGPAQPASAEATAKHEAYATTVAYVSQFYPLWFTYNQSRHASHNRLVGPARVTPLYQTVVAINVDTLYASTFLELPAQAVVLTIPKTVATYSILTLDAYGDIFETGIQPGKPGAYALTGPGFAGTLPTGVTPIFIPFNFSVLIFRVDKFSGSGENQIAAAADFRRSLMTQPLCAYTRTPCPGGTPALGKALILPEAAFAIPYKTIADRMIAKDPIKFLKQLQTAVAAPNTPPLSPAARSLSDHFDQLFGDGKRQRWDFAAGAQAAHDLIVERYLTHTGPTNWITFTNIGDWGDQFVERSAITEFIQYGNGHSSAAYYQAFKDAEGRALDGKDGQSYVLRFPAGQLPQASRFWSVTAYTPEAIELIPNSAKKYDVASYEPGLVKNADGSLSIHLATSLPPGVPAANWLPIAGRPFNIMLRVYGPEGSVADNTYVPPAVQRNH
jgi:hypothetical protein